MYQSIKEQNEFDIHYTQNTQKFDNIIYNIYTQNTIKCIHFNIEIIKLNNLSIFL